MDLDIELVSALVARGKEGFQVLGNAGVTAADLQGPGRIALTFLKLHFDQYGEIPPADLILAKTRVVLPPPTAALEFYANEIASGRLLGNLQSGLHGAINHIQSGQGDEAVASLQKLVEAAKNDIPSHAVGLPDLADQAEAHYELLKSGKRGILTPWKALNDSTLGFWPEDLVLFVARLGVGKTWLAIIMAHYAWKNGYRVLFASTEMAQRALAVRFAAFSTSLPYEQVRHGRLSSPDEKVFKEALREFRKDETFHMVGGKFKLSPTVLETAVRKHEPHLTIMDGAYLLQTEGYNRTERAANAFDQLKIICQGTGTAMVATSQLNRDAKKNPGGKPSVENIALSDVAGWNADHIWALNQTQDQKADHLMGIDPLKIREGYGEAFTTNWDFEKMEFSQVYDQGRGNFDVGFTASDLAVPGAVDVDPNQTHADLF